MIAEPGFARLCSAPLTKARSPGDPLAVVMASAQPKPDFERQVAFANSATPALFKDRRE
jgi:hypothetical protein